MRTTGSVIGSRAGAPLGMVLLLASVAAPTPVAAIDCNADQARPDGVRAVRGTTFVGVYDGFRDGYERWDVEAWYAGPTFGDVAYPRDPCRPLDFEPGRRYLFSTSDIGSPTSQDSVAYRVIDEDDLRMVRFEGAVPPRDYPARLRVGSMDEALKVLVPPDAPRAAPSAIGVLVGFAVWLVRTLGLD